MTFTQTNYEVQILMQDIQKYMKKMEDEVDLVRKTRYEIKVRKYQKKLMKILNQQTARNPVADEQKAFSPVIEDPITNENPVVVNSQSLARDASRQIPREIMEELEELRQRNGESHSRRYSGSTINSSHRKYARPSTPCAICGKVGLDTGNLQQHIVACHIDEDAVVLQNALNQSISTKLQEKWKLKHNEGQVKCEVLNCNTFLKSSRSLRIHIINVHSDLDPVSFKSILQKTLDLASRGRAPTQAHTQPQHQGNTDIHTQMQPDFDVNQEDFPLEPEFEQNSRNSENITYTEFATGQRLQQPQDAEMSKSQIEDVVEYVVEDAAEDVVEKASEIDDSDNIHDTLEAIKNDILNEKTRMIIEQQKLHFEIQNLKSTEGMQIFNFENEISLCDDSAKRQTLERSLLVHKSDMLRKIRDLQFKESEIKLKGNEAISTSFEKYNTVFKHSVLQSINK